MLGGSIALHSAHRGCAAGFDRVAYRS